MLYLYINGSDRTGDLQRDTLEISNQLQQRSDSCSFKLFQGTKPSENQSIRVFAADTIANVAGATLTLDGNYPMNTGRFYVGQTLFVRIGDADEEKVTVQSYTESTLTLVLSSAPSGVVSVGDKIGVLIFGGVISRVRDSNVHVLTNIEYDIQAIDYTKIFEKKLVSDSWADVDSRYVINGFVNTAVNYNRTVDDMDYDNNGDLQAEWIETGDGNNPTRDTSDYLEGTSSAILDWTNAGGTATFSGTPTSYDVSEFTGAGTGTPTKGKLMLWIKASDYTVVTSIKVRIGSSAANYAEITMTAPTTNDWYYVSVDLDTAAITGVPDWSVMDYAAFVITETGDGNIRVNGLRINAEGSFTLNNVEATPLIDDFRSSALKPTKLMQLLSKMWSFLWYIDYEQDIHFKSIETDASPFNLTETSGNFFDLKVQVDQSQIGNRIIVRGGKKLSDSQYAQVFQGNDTWREWKLKRDFSFTDFEISIDDNSDVHAAEAGTTTTNIKITGHGLTTGSHVINRTRGVVRQITYVDVDNFTVQTVTGQVATDNISFFSTSKTIGIEGLADETAVDYVGSQDDESVRSTESEATLTATDYIRFEYYERVPIRIQYSDAASATSLRSMGFGDGIFDLDPYTDDNIEDVNTALAIAQAKVEEYSNAIITGSFQTDQFGLKAGQLITITDSNRSLDAQYVIQKISVKQTSGEHGDYFVYNVFFGTTLFGIIEFFQKLLSMQDSIEQNVDDIVETYVDSHETVESADVSVARSGGDENANSTETVEASESNQVVDWPMGTWKFEPSIGQTLESRFDLCDFG